MKLFMCKNRIDQNMVEIYFPTVQKPNEPVVMTAIMSLDAIHDVFGPLVQKTIRADRGMVAVEVAAEVVP